MQPPGKIPGEIDNRKRDDERLSQLANFMTL